MLDLHCLAATDAVQVGPWVIAAAKWVVERGGRLRWIEELLSVERMQDVTIWGKFDLALHGGDMSPLEIVDLTFGRLRAETPEDLRQSIGAKIYRLVAGHCEPDQAIRPIAITELHAPSMSVVTIIPSDDDVREAWAEVKSIAQEIRVARATNEFPATPGRHCSWCSYRELCPVARAGSDELPL